MAQISPQVAQWFQANDTNRTGSLDFNQLCYALRNGDNTAFRPETCKLMINMFDQAGNGLIDMQEFQQITNFLSTWKQSFMSFDHTKNGGLNVSEAHQIFTEMGFKLSAEMIGKIIAKFDVERKGVLIFDDFIRVCCLMQSLSSQFNQFEVNQQGSAWVNFDWAFMMICHIGI